MDVYGQSKLANVMFTISLLRKFDENNINFKAVSVHSGAVRTDLVR